MKKMIYFILYLIPLYAWSQEFENQQALTNVIQDNPDSIKASKSKTINHLGFYYDSYMTPRTGTETVLLLHHGFTFLEDEIIGSKWTAEETFLQKSAGITGRLAKYIFMDIPFNYLLFIGSHEYFGHGARYREFDLGKIDYHLGIPPPYGIGGGYANVSNYTREASDHERIAIWTGGFEAHDILNRRLSLRWMSDGESHYNENILYFWSWQDKFQYIQSNSEYLPIDLNGPLNDPEGYVYFLNRNSGFDADNLQLDIKDLQKRNYVNLVNPFVWYSLYFQLVNYLYKGHTYSDIPMFHMKNISYLPSLRMSLTPFGPQYQLENYISWRRTTSLIDISIGDQTFYQDWWGLGIQIQNIYEINRFSFDAYINTWEQPELEFGENIINSTKNQFGLAFSITGYYDITKSNYPISIISEVGYKTSGYIQGYELGATPIIRFGLGIRY